MVTVKRRNLLSFLLSVPFVGRVKRLGGGFAFDVAAASPAPAALPKLRGYTDRQSVAQGQRITFFLSNLQGLDLDVSVEIIRLGLEESRKAIVAGTAHAATIGDRGAGNQRWKESFTLTVGKSWTPGVYVARVEGLQVDKKDIFFVVKRAGRPYPNPVVIQIPTATINAYCNWGGASLYDFNSTSHRAAWVSFNRPQETDSRWHDGYSFQEEWSLRIKNLVQWMEVVGYGADVITSNDVHEDPLILDNYQLFISIGHDEYWSQEMRNHFDAFVERGGNAAIFGGNTGYWQIRLEADEVTGETSRRQVCHKNAAADSVADPALKTVTWREAGRPENLSFGAGYDRGAWRGAGKIGAFTAYNTNHWVFFGTEVGDGDTFCAGADDAVLRYETNSIAFVRSATGTPQPTGTDGTPLDYQVLGLADLADWSLPGNAAMGVFTKTGSGGTVFNAATTDWARGLRRCVVGPDHFGTIVAKITRNVIDHLTPVLYVDVGSTSGYANGHRYRPGKIGDRLSGAVAFRAYAAPVDAELIPVRRYTSRRTGMEILTANTSRPPSDWIDNGTAFFAYAAPAIDRLPVFRILCGASGDDACERYSIDATLYRAESSAGIAFYAPK